ncbi:MAG: hypothetical protein LQ343_006049 [Gyalolechia ehrenbergii]|nr:MAG: hypothetical protein LQ343_006049 [Gyalolechia ehrenbergii]
MLSPPLLSQTLLHILTLSYLASAVSVTISAYVGGLQQICHHLQPGQCCQALPLSFINHFNAFNPNTVQFSFLLATDIAAAWSRRGNIRACSGLPLATGIGPGNWAHEGYGDARPVGASFVTLPKTLPPGDAEAKWLAAEGMLGLVWGGGQWFAKGTAGWGNVGGGSQGLRRRRVISERKGTAYVKGPSRSRWPDVVVVNGTTYTGNGTFGEGYRSSDGRLLDLGG